MGSTRIKGNKKPFLEIGAPGAEYATDLISYSFENEEADADTVTFEDAENGGGRTHYLRGSAIQSTDAESFWRYVWANSGASEIPFTVAPHGNEVATADQPHLIGTLNIGPKPTLGAEASTSRTSASSFDFEFEIDGEPTLDTGVAGG